MYQTIDAHTVYRISDRTSIPADPENVDYQMYLAWLAEVNEPPASGPSDPDEGGAQTPATDL